MPFNEIDNQYFTSVNVTHFSIFALVKNYCEEWWWGNTSTKHIQSVQYTEYCRAKEDDYAIELFCYNETSETIFLDKLSKKSPTNKLDCIDDLSVPIDRDFNLY